MKQNLLLLHGALGSKAQFKSLEEKLSSQFEVHAFDFEGHGNRASTKGFTMDLFVDNVIEYLQENKIEKTNIFGYSMGGYVALKLASKSPELVGKIMTLGTKFDWTKETAAKEIKMLNPDKIEEKIPAFANMLASTHPASHWKEVVTKTAQMMHGLGNGKRLTTADLEQIKHETLIGIGSLDQMVSVDESKESADSLPNGHLKTIEGFKHPIHKVNDEELASIIVDFLKK